MQDAHPDVKFTRDGAAEGSRTSRDKLPERDLHVATVLDSVADELGISSSQAAVAWTRTHHRWIHPIIGARTVEQLNDSVAALNVELPADAVRRLEEAGSFELGFPQDFITMTGEFVYGEAGSRFEARR